MKPKIKYDVNVFGIKNKKSMMKNLFLFYEETMQHNESTISSLVVQQMFPCKQKSCRIWSRFPLGKNLHLLQLILLKLRSYLKRCITRRAHMVLSLKLWMFLVSRLLLGLLKRIPTWTQTDRLSAIFSYVLLRCRVAVYISNVSVQDKVFFSGLKHRGTNKR